MTLRITMMIMLACTVLAVAAAADMSRMLARMDTLNIVERDAVAVAVAGTAAFAVVVVADNVAAKDFVVAVDDIIDAVGTATVTFDNLLDVAAAVAAVSLVSAVHPARAQTDIVVLAVEFGPEVAVPALLDMLAVGLDVVAVAVAADGAAAMLVV